MFYFILLLNFIIIYISHRECFTIFTILIHDTRTEMRNKDFLNLDAQVCTEVFYINDTFLINVSQQVLQQYI